MANVPQVIQDYASGIATTSANVKVMGLSSYGSATTVVGVCWSTTQSLPTLANADGHTTHPVYWNGPWVPQPYYDDSISGLSPGTHYHVRAYAINSSGTGYNTVADQFDTLYAQPTVYTGLTYADSPTTGVSSVSVGATGGGTISDSGVCWNTGGNPTIGNSHTTGGAGAIGGLSAGVTVYVRAYATNSGGLTGYGAQTSFTTPVPAVPTVSTGTTYPVGADHGVSGGNVSAENWATVSSRGVCWAAGTTPYASGLHTTDGSGLGAFTSALTGLLPATTYYVRAWAANSVGTGYGGIVTLTTPTPATPSVQTTPPSAIAGTTAEAGGVVTSIGTEPVTARGVCRNTTGSPTTGNTSTNDGSGLGAFVSSLSGLTSGQTYYIRAFATNSVGTSYGQQYAFYTCDPPTVQTAVVHDVRAVSAASGGNVTADGNSPVTERGVCWGTSAAPTLADAHSSDGIGTGEYDSVISGLATSTLYHVRAYATNARGTTYGNESDFTTLAQSISTTAVTGVTETGAVSGGAVTGSTPTVTSRGVCWNLTGSPTPANWKTVNGSGAGAFTSALTGLSPETTYFVRAYAVTTGGTIYGEEIAFPTTPHLRCSLGRNTAWARVLTPAEVLADTEAGMEYFGRSLAKGTVVLRGLVRNRKGALVPASHVRAGWWIQNTEAAFDNVGAEQGEPLYITGHSIDLAEMKNACTIGVDWMEREIGVRMGELLAMPATAAPGGAAPHEYVPDAAPPPADHSEPWMPEPYAEPWAPGAYKDPGESKPSDPYDPGPTYDEPWMPEPPVEPPPPPPPPPGEPDPTEPDPEPFDPHTFMYPIPPKPTWCPQGMMYVVEWIDLTPNGTRLSSRTAKPGWYPHWIMVPGPDYKGVPGPGTGRPTG